METIQCPPVNPVYHCHIHPLQAANCCRNSRLVVDEDDLKWVTNRANITLLLFVRLFHENFSSKTTGFPNLSHSSEMQDDPLMHREGVKG